MIRLGFIGVGGYGREHLEGFRAFQAEGQVRFQAVADPSKAARAAALSLAELREAAIYADYREMLQQEELDAVVVSAPIPLHREIARQALARDLFVLLEKPPVPLLSELQELIAADPRERVMVGFQHIYRPLVQEMKRVVWSGEIGEPLAISALGLWPRATEYYERSPWVGALFWEGRATLDGPCTNAMAHFLNSLFFLGGREALAYAGPERLAGEVYRARPVASYDVAALRGYLDNGMWFSAALAHATARKTPACLRVEGTKGRVELFDDAQKFRDARGRVQEGSDGRRELRQAFLAMAEGEPERNLTGLRAMEPYVAATNMMFQSAGGIRDIGREFVEIREAGTPDEVYAVPGLEEAFRTAGENMTSLSQSGVAWAGASHGISRADFEEARMLEGLAGESLAVR